MTTTVTLHDLVWDRLQLAPNAYVYGTMLVYDGEPLAVPPYDDDGRISSYACLYMFPGLLFHSSLTGDQTSLTGQFQVTCVGGDIVRVLAAVDAVRATLPGPTTLGGVNRVIRQDESNAQAPIRTDSGVWPPRHYVALDFRLFAP